GRRYDVVVVDPPSFAQNQAAVERAVAAYRRLTALTLDVLAPGGLLFQASCSSRVPAERFFAAVADEAARHGHGLEVVARTGHPADHPVGFPQGAYLKAILARRSTTRAR
ncbi:MAG: class I SAM-dependent methyltransferase, partial [Acidimicrobiia bacterium]|nr:class I SAM-dependent methyltransferase [Acidimicrobiia bacterium]